MPAGRPQEKQAMLLPGRKKRNTTKVSKSA